MWWGLLLLALLQQLPPPFPPPPMPPPPIDENYSVSFEMKLSTSAPAWFTPEQIGGRPLDSIADNAYCEGRLAEGGTYRYYTDKRMPTALVGALVPWNPAIPPPADASGTLEQDGTTVILYDKQLVLGFRAVNATSNVTVIQWTCQL